MILVTQDVLYIDRWRLVTKSRVSLTKPRWVACQFGVGSTGGACQFLFRAKVFNGDGSAHY